MRQNRGNRWTDTVRLSVSVSRVSLRIRSFDSDLLKVADEHGSEGVEHGYSLLILTEQFHQLLVAIKSHYPFLVYGIEHLAELGSQLGDVSLSGPVRHDDFPLLSERKSGSPGKARR